MNGDENGKLESQNVVAILVVVRLMDGHRYGGQSVERKDYNLLFLFNSIDKYIAYFTAPFVIFVKDKISQLVFIMLHCRVCVSASSVEPTTEEYFIFVFFAGLVLSEFQQYKGSPHKYFK